MKTERRTSLKRILLLGFGMALGKLDVFHAAGGQLTCDLNQWSHVVFILKGKRIEVPVAEIFEALSGGLG